MSGATTYGALVGMAAEVDGAGLITALLWITAPIAVPGVPRRVQH